jgi:hypothetical protein
MRVDLFCYLKRFASSAAGALLHAELSTAYCAAQFDRMIYHLLHEADAPRSFEQASCNAALHWNSDDRLLLAAAHQVTGVFWHARR